jgi:DNA gyrase/topoisomerase IV subunit A
VKASEKTGKMVAIKEVVDTDDVVIVTSDGMVIRQHAADIRVAGRNTQGVHLIRLKEGDSIADVAAVVAEEEEEKQLAEKEKNGANNKSSTPDKPLISGRDELKQENIVTPKPDKNEKKKPALPTKPAKKLSNKKKK